VEREERPLWMLFFYEVEIVRIHLLSWSGGQVSFLVIIYKKKPGEVEV
jgi:hypothetical protein